jgi:hypothetical protein
VSVSAVPSRTRIGSGTLKSGDAPSLAANDGQVLQIAAPKSRRRVTSWSGRIEGVSSDLSALSVTYAGSHSARCRQTISLWNWTTGSWDRFTLTIGGPVESEVTFSPATSLGSYVSGRLGDGDVIVRVHCRRNDRLPFTTRGDLLRVAFEKRMRQPASLLE